MRNKFALQHPKTTHMKSMLFSLLCLFTVMQYGFAQTIGKIAKLKDAWGLTYNYSGEIKDGKPNGMGVAKYESGNVLRYVGQFVNGTYNGKGTMLFDDGAFLTGNWKNGKLNGMGTNLNADGSLYIGEFGNGIKNGFGTLIYKDNSFVKGNFKDDKMQGRIVNLWTDGNIISDIIYVNDKRNGTGYQYEAKSKKLYEGEWANDKWVQATTPTFTSFLKAPGFFGESTSSHVLMGPINAAKFLIDTSYYYDLDKKKRYFGYYVNGHLRNGLIIRDDSTRFMGPLNDKGASGYCYDFKVGKYYSEGNYTDDYLNGKILDIDLEKKSVYYGDAINGAFTGKAYFFNENGSMYIGDYLKGKFTGNGSRLQTNGKLVTGTWDDGKVTTLTSITTEDGDVVSGAPKTFAEGINAAVRTYLNYYDDIVGDYVDDYDLLDELEGDDEDSYLDFNYSLIKLPGSEENIIATDFDMITFWYARFLKTESKEKAIARYKELATQLQAVSISSGALPAKTKLTGTVNLPTGSDDSAETEFSLANPGEKFKYFKVWLTLEKNYDDMYIVSISMGEQ